MVPSLHIPLHLFLGYALPTFHHKCLEYLATRFSFVHHYLNQSSVPVRVFFTVCEYVVSIFLYFHSYAIVKNRVEGSQKIKIPLTLETWIHVRLSHYLELDKKNFVKIDFQMPECGSKASMQVSVLNCHYGKNLDKFL